MQTWFRFTVVLFSLGFIMFFFGCGRNASNEPVKPTDVVLHVPGMNGPSGGPDRVRKALGTLPWVEQDTIQTDIPTREVRFDLKDKTGFNEEEVREALKDQRFKEMTVKVAPQGYRIVLAFRDCRLKVEK